MNWLDRARSEIKQSAQRPTAVTAERDLTTVLAVHGQPLSEKSIIDCRERSNTPSGAEHRETVNTEHVVVRQPDGTSVSSKWPFVTQLDDGSYSGYWIDSLDEVINGRDEIEVVNRLYEVREAGRIIAHQGSKTVTQRERGGASES